MTGNNAYIQLIQDTVPTNTIGPRLVELLNGEPGQRADYMVFCNFAC